MGIMLILTLTISAFKPGDDPLGQYMVGGDYSAVFPLLVVSVFIALMAARDTVFYIAQTSRGDITAVPEVLCQPNKVGAPVVLRYAGGESDDDDVTTASGSGDIATSEELTKTEEQMIQDTAALLKGESPTASGSVSHHSYHKQSSSSSFQQRDKMVHHETFGDLEGHQQPSLTDQALLHASSSVSHSHHRSSSSVGTSSGPQDSSTGGSFIFSLFRKSSRNIDQD